jgi:hypothetical protein
MRITKKDELIYHYIEEMGFATVKQVTELFFNDIEYGKTLARKRLNCLIEHGYIKETKSTNCSQHIFYVDPKHSRKTHHAIILMDLYVRFRQMNSLKILNFEREVPFCNKKILSDGFITVTYKVQEGVAVQNFIIEVQTSNNDFKKVLGKYYDGDIVREINAKCEGYLPVIIYVDDVTHNMDNVRCPYQVIQVDEKLTDFPLIFESH